MLRCKIGGNSSMSIRCGCSMLHTAYHQTASRVALQRVLRHTARAPWVIARRRDPSASHQQQHSFDRGSRWLLTTIWVQTISCRLVSGPEVSAG